MCKSRSIHYISRDHGAVNEWATTVVATPKPKPQAVTVYPVVTELQLTLLVGSHCLVSLVSCPSSSFSLSHLLSPLSLYLNLFWVCYFPLRFVPSVTTASINLFCLPSFFWPLLFFYFFKMFLIRFELW